MIFSNQTFMLIATGSTALVSGWWLVMDLLRINKSLRERPRTGWVRDRIFGSVIGISSALLGLGGIVLYYLQH